MNATEPVDRRSSAAIYAIHQTKDVAVLFVVGAHTTLQSGRLAIAARKTAAGSAS